MKTVAHRLSRRRPIVPRHTTRAHVVKALLLKGKTPEEIKAVVPVSSVMISYHRERLGLPRFKAERPPHGLKLRITRSHPAWFLTEFSAEAKGLHMSQNRLAELVYVYWRQEMGRMSTAARRNTIDRLQDALSVAYVVKARR